MISNFLEKYNQRPWYYSLQRFTANKTAVISFVILLVIIFMAIAAPLLAKTDYDQMIFMDDVLSFPSSEHIFGVDSMGRDFFSRIVYGARVSLGVGVAGAFLSLVIGVPLGTLAGYKGGVADWVIMRIVEIFSVIPPLLIAILIAALVGGGVRNVIIISSLFGWVGVCRLVRGQILTTKNREFIAASKVLGASPFYIITRHLLPNSISPIIVGFVLSIPGAMMLEASLSFLGVGINPPIPSWGQMINEGLDFMFYYWHLAVFPTLFLAITVLATSLFGDGLRDALDPTMKGR